MRHSGGTQDLNQLQLFAWQSESRGHDVHLQSNPTAAALAHKEFLAKKDVLKETSAASILDRYGGEEFLQAAPRELRAGQDEGYVEYDRRGKVVKGMERAKAKSKYDEDGASLLPLSHSRSLPHLGLVVRRRRGMLTPSALAVQSSPATTTRCGARGTTSRRASGATRAATLCSRALTAVRFPLSLSLSPFRSSLLRSWRPSQSMP